jgi:hypothetical protein
MERSFQTPLLTEVETRATLALVYPQTDTIARPALAENAFEIASADVSLKPYRKALAGSATAHVARWDPMRRGRMF